MTKFDIVKDLHLGKLTYDNFGDKVSNCCRIKLPISIYPIDIFFDTDSSDNLPTVKQKQFLKDLVKEVDILFSKPEAIFSDTYINNLLLTGGQFKNDLQAVSLVVPMVD